MLGYFLKKNLLFFIRLGGLETWYVSSGRSARSHLENRENLINRMQETAADVRRNAR